MLIFFLLLIISNYSQCSLTNFKQKIVKSLILELNIKHSTIIKDSDFQINIKIVNFVKQLSKTNIYTSFASLDQMKNLMFYYHDKPEEYYFSKNAYKLEHELDKRRANLVYPPKTIILVKELQPDLNKLFTVSKHRQ